MATQQTRIYNVLLQKLVVAIQPITLIGYLGLDK
jgi:hypothetical protein